MKTKFFRITSIIFLMTFLACGQNTSPLHNSLLEKQPYVLEINPANGSTLSDPIQWTIKFSQRIDLKTVGHPAINLIAGELESELKNDTKKLMKAIKEENLLCLKLHYLLESDEQTLIVEPEALLSDGIYQLVITPALISTQGVPLNQTPGETPQAFIATFAIGEDIVLNLPIDPSEDIIFEETPPTFGPDPEFLVINEVLYDGVESDTNGENFIELFGTPNADISAYEISLINGANGEETDRITLPNGAIIPTDGVYVIADLETGSDNSTKVLNFDFLDNFDPQNGPDAIHLLDRDGNLLDALLYGDGAVATTPEGIPLGEDLPANDVPAGWSLTRLNGGTDTDVNGADFLMVEFPSPGVE